MELTLIGKTNYRNEYKTFGIRHPDRFSHLFILGKTGTGKSTLLKNLVLQDILAGRGCGLLDPHGDLASEVVALVPEDQRHRLVYLNLPDPKLKWGYNPLAYVAEERRSLLASGILEIFKKLWPKEWGVRMEHLFRNAILTLLEQPRATLNDVIRVFVDASYRRQCLRNVANQQVLRFWHKEFAQYSYRLRAEATVPIANKLGGFLSNPKLYRFLCSAEKPLRLRAVMDKKQILIVNLAKGQIGDDAVNLLGSLLLTSIGLAAYSRSDTPEKVRTPFHLAIDEMHNFVTLSTANMMSELRKYSLSLALASQFLFQHTADVREAVLGNAGSLICFRLGARDATYMEKEFKGVFRAEDFLTLPNYHMYLKLMIGGMPSRGFSGQTVHLISTS